MKCYERLVDAAKAQYEAKQQRLSEMRDDLLAELNLEDALSLRKLEREEIMKGVLRWLCGPKFRFYRQDDPDFPPLPNLPLDLQETDLSSAANLEDTALPFYDPATQSVHVEFHEAYLQFGELIKLLHQAVEWENVSYLLYPYFWTYPDKYRWDFKQSLYHSDFVHRTFLRAGAARVVLSIRPGFEREFLSLMEGDFAGSLPNDHAYMSIADELEAMAKTNYPYTADANLDKEEYLFTWDNVPGSESGRLQRQLRQNFYIAWAEEDATTITKSAYDNIIQVAIDKEVQGQPGMRMTGSVSIALDEEKGVAVLKVTEGKSYDLSARQESGKWKVYRLQNLVDTWYEFTPTGAMDIVEGNVIEE